MRKIRTLLALSAALLPIACAARPADPATIVIGVTGPFGQPRGISMRLSAELARDEINAAGGIGGRPVELVFEDDSASADAAIRIADRFRSDRRVVAVVGHLTSVATAAAAPIYNGNGRPMALITPSASAPALSEEGGRAVFRICPTDFAHGRELARYARRVLHASTAAILYENDAYGRGVSGNFEEEFANLGGGVVVADPYNKQISSFEPYLRLLQLRGGADVILIAGTRDGAERILATRDSVGLEGTILAGDGVVGIESSPLAEGMLVSSAWLPGAPDSATQKFVAAYQARHPGLTPDHRGAGTYDIIRLLEKAVLTVGTDRGRIVEYLEGVGTRTPAYLGVTGKIAFDADGDAIDKVVTIGMVRGRVLLPTRN